MLARVRSAAVLGIDAYLVDVEVDIAHGLPSFATVGLPQGAIKEGRERVSAAIVNSGFEFPLRRITCNLAPADIKKDGSAFDLPIALGVIAAMQPDDANGRPSRDDYAVVGELGLEGGIRAIRGALSVAIGAKQAGLKGVIVPEANLAEAGVVDGIEVLGASNLTEVAAFFRGEGRLIPSAVDRAALFGQTADEGVDFSEVRGQQHA